MGSAVKFYLNLRFFFERERIIWGKLKPFFYNLKKYIIDSHVITRNVSRKRLFRKTHHYLQSEFLSGNSPFHYLTTKTKMYVLAACNS